MCIYANEAWNNNNKNFSTQYKIRKFILYLDIAVKLLSVCNVWCVLISNFYLVKPLRYQQKKIWSERTDSCQYGHHLPYMDIDTTEHAPHLYCTCAFLKFLVPDTPTFTKNASFQQQKVAYLPRPGCAAVEKMSR